MTTRRADPRRFHTRRADPGDAEAIADAHRDSIRTIGPRFYLPYVRGGASRRGIGTTLLRLAEAHAIEHGAKAVQIQASLAGVEFYKSNGFEETGRGEAMLMSGQTMPCVFMRKRL